MLHKTGPGQVAVADGAICPQMVKCGKPGCKCARGELHRAFYLFWRERGRPRKPYVRRADLGATREACRRWRQAGRSIRGLVNGPEGGEQRRQMRATLREALGVQINSPGGKGRLRRLRSRSPGQKADYALERLAGAYLGVELKLFRF